MSDNERNYASSELEELANAVVALRALKVARIETTYEGSGDSGMVNYFQCYDEEGNEVDWGTLPEDLQRIINEAVEAVIPAGYEVNEGGGGVAIINLRTFTIRLEHYNNVMVQESDEPVLIDLTTFKGRELPYKDDDNGAD